MSDVIKFNEHKPHIRHVLVDINGDRVIMLCVEDNTNALSLVRRDGDPREIKGVYSDEGFDIDAMMHDYNNSDDWQELDLEVSLQDHIATAILAHE